MITYADISKGKQLPNTGPIRKLFHCVNESVARYSGFGSFYAKYQYGLSGFNRLKNSLLPPNYVKPGYTFITRPKLNLSTTSINQNRTLSLLNTNEPKSIAFMTRCLLDTDYAYRPDIKPLAEASPFLDTRSPFILPLSNNVLSSAGWPTKVMDVETTPDGFQGENFTYALGVDKLAKTYDITLTIREIGGINMHILNNWFLGMECLTSGECYPYRRFSMLKRMCYDCSIYRLVMDMTNTKVIGIARATNAFLRSVPYGSIFDENENEHYVNAMQQYSIPFIANSVTLGDPILLQEFNMLAERYWPALKDPVGNGLVDVTEVNPYLNNVGLPHIDLHDGSNRLRFWATKEEVRDPLKDAVDDLMSEIVAAEEERRKANRVIENGEFGR